MLSQAAIAERSASTRLQQPEKTMPRDIPYIESAASPSRGTRQSALRPVESSSSVWAIALREYRVETAGQLPLRARLLDVLEHMQRGHLLALMGTTLPVVWLDGYQDIAVLAGVLFSFGYVEIVGRHRDNADIVYFGLSACGERKLREGRQWWDSLSVWRRLKVRFFG